MGEGRYSTGSNAARLRSARGTPESSDVDRAYGNSLDPAFGALGGTALCRQDHAADLFVDIHGD